MSELVMVSEKDGYSTKPASELNMQNVRYLVNRDAHPHPVILVVIVIVLMVMFYYLYVSYWKTCFNGKWLNAEGDILYVKHNKWNDSILVNEHINGYIKGDAIYLKVGGKMNLGVLFEESIYWINNDVWTRPAKVFS